VRVVFEGLGVDELTDGVDGAREHPANRRAATRPKIVFTRTTLSTLLWVKVEWKESTHPEEARAEMDHLAAVADTVSDMIDSGTRT
jgi:hypothetical protein